MSTSVSRSRYETRGGAWWPADKDGPAFDDREVTSAYENEIHPYYDLNGRRSSEDRGGYRAHFGYSKGEHPGEVPPGTRMGGTEPAEFRGLGGDKGVPREYGSDLADELRAPRIEAELGGTRERKDDAVNMRERVRTDHEHAFDENSSSL